MLKTYVFFKGPNGNDGSPGRDGALGKRVCRHYMCFCVKVVPNGNYILPNVICDINIEVPNYIFNAYSFSALRRFGYIL